MKKFIISILILLIILVIGFTIYNKNNDIETPKVDEQTFKPSTEPEINEYVDNNPIKLGLYKYYGRSKDRELITEYISNWNYHNDISSFEVFFTNENSISGNQFQTKFQEYFDKYENIQNYKIGYIVSFLTKESEINKTILSPKDTEEFFDYLEIYLYDDYHRQVGVWYSHTTEEEMNEETLLTSIKLTAGKNINDIVSDITVTAFTYDTDDFDEEDNYKGISKHTIIVKKTFD